jgi:hypothetical protein
MVTQEAYSGTVILFKSEMELFKKLYEFATFILALLFLNQYISFKF